jgi:hypothetical protein
MKTLLCLVWLLTGSPIYSAYTQPTYIPSGDHAYLSSKHIFNHVHDDQPMRGGDLEGLPEAHPIAVIPAAPHPNEVAESERAYAAGHLAEAANAVAALARQQPADPTVLNCYARALYRYEATRSQSYPIYQKLIALLDRYGHEGPTVVSIYSQFAEAHIKLATLQLDAKHWAAASYNLSRAASIMETLGDLQTDNPGLCEQILQYQTECFANLHNTKLCRYFGQRTLRFFPKNQYVKNYLASLPPPQRRPVTR